MSIEKIHNLVQTYKEHSPQNFEFDEEIIQIIKNVYTYVCTLPNIEIINEPIDIRSHQFKAVINLKNYNPLDINAKKELIQLLSTYLREEVHTFIQNVQSSSSTIYIHNPMLVSFQNHFVRFSITYGI